MMSGVFAGVFCLLYLARAASAAGTLSYADYIRRKNPHSVARGCHLVNNYEWSRPIGLPPIVFVSVVRNLETTAKWVR